MAYWESEVGRMGWERVKDALQAAEPNPKPNPNSNWNELKTYYRQLGIPRKSIPEFHVNLSLNST